MFLLFPVRLLSLWGSVSKKSRKYAWKLDKMVKAGSLSAGQARMAFAAFEAVNDSVKRINKAAVPAGHVSMTYKAGVTKSQALKSAEKTMKKNAERLRGVMAGHMERTWRTSENPAEREAAYTAMLKYRDGKA